MRGDPRIGQLELLIVMSNQTLRVPRVCFGLIEDSNKVSTVHAGRRKSELMKPNNGQKSIPMRIIRAVAQRSALDGQGGASVLLEWVVPDRQQTG